MSGMPHEPLSQADVLLEGFLALDTPEGFRAELIEGEIVVTPPPDGDHEDCISMIMKQVIRHARTDMDFSGNKGLKLRSGGGCPKNHVIPDGTFAPTGLRLYAERTPGCRARAWPWSSRSPRPSRLPTAPALLRPGTRPPPPAGRPRGVLGHAVQRPAGGRLPPALHGPVRQGRPSAGALRAGPGDRRVRLSRRIALSGGPRRTGSMGATADEPGGRPREDLRILPRNVRAPQGRVMANGHPG